MFRHRTSMIVLATVLGSLANQELLKDRHRNYNANSNYNQLFGGYNGGPARETANERDRGTSVANSPKYDAGMKAGLDGEKGRGGMYVVPKYVVRGSGSGGMGAGVQGAGGLGAEVVASGVPASSGFPAGYDTIADGMGYGDGYGGEICDNHYKQKPMGNQIFRYDNEDDKPVWEDPRDDDGSPEGLFIYNSNYNVVFKGSRRLSGRRRYSGGRGGWGNANSNANNNAIRSGYRRANDNWGPLRTTYYVEPEQTYVIDLQPNYVTDRQLVYGADRQSAYGADRQSTYGADRQSAYGADRQSAYGADRQSAYGGDRQSAYGADRQPNYVTDRQSAHPNERQSILPSELRSYPTTLEPIDDEDDYDRDYWGSNMNSNVNFNYLSGRRSNVNSNANNNQIGFGGSGGSGGSGGAGGFGGSGGSGGSGPSRGRERYSPAPSYSGMNDEGYNADRSQRKRVGGTRGGYTPVKNRQSDIRSRPKFIADEEDEDADNDVYDDYPSFGDANINTNTNTNIMSRRNNPRKRRSVSGFPKKSHTTETVETDGTTEKSKVKNSSVGSVAQKSDSSAI